MSEYALNFKELRAAEAFLSEEDETTVPSPPTESVWQSRTLFEVPAFSAEDIAEARRLCRDADTYMNIPAIMMDDEALALSAQQPERAEQARIKRRGASAIRTLSGGARLRREIDETPTVRTLPAAAPEAQAPKKPSWAISETMWFMVGDIPVGLAEVEAEEQDFNGLERLNERYRKRSELPDTVRRRYSLDSDS